MAEVSMSNIAKSFSTPYLWGQLWFFGIIASVTTITLVIMVHIALRKKKIADYNSSRKIKKTAKWTIFEASS